jgi:hypothetical protein
MAIGHPCIARACSQANLGKGMTEKRETAAAEGVALYVKRQIGR